MSFCPKTVTYVIQKGDNLYQLSRQFKTSVQDIWLRNPGLDPYNLQIGSVLTVCPGPNYSGLARTASYPNPETKERLTAQMRQAWEQHVFWTRLYLVSVASRLPDTAETEKRLLQNAGDIANIFGEFYNRETQKTIQELLTEHLQIGGSLIAALRDRQTAEAENLNKAWYQNADQIASAFASINPHYSETEVKEMMHTHLDLTSKKFAAYLSGDYATDIAFFDKVEQEALEMADYFSQGIFKQFPQM